MKPSSDIPFFLFPKQFGFSTSHSVYECVEILESPITQEKILFSINVIQFIVKRGRGNTYNFTLVIYMSSTGMELLRGKGVIEPATSGAKIRGTIYFSLRYFGLGILLWLVVIPVILNRQSWIQGPALIIATVGILLQPIIVSFVNRGKAIQAIKESIEEGLKSSSDTD